MRTEAEVRDRLAHIEQGADLMISWIKNKEGDQKVNFATLYGLQKTRNQLLWVLEEL